MVAIEPAHLLASYTAGRHWHEMDIGVIGHRVHGGFYVPGQFPCKMLLEHFKHRLLGWGYVLFRHSSMATFLLSPHECRLRNMGMVPLGEVWCISEASRSKGAAVCPYSPNFRERPSETSYDRTNLFTIRRLIAM